MELKKKQVKNESQYNKNKLTGTSVLLYFSIPCGFKINIIYNFTKSDITRAAFNVYK